MTSAADTILSRNRVMWCNSICRGKPPQVFIDATSCGLASIRYLTIDPPTQAPGFPAVLVIWMSI